MTVKEFVEKYNKDESALKNCVTCKYLSYVKKCNLCERIIKATYYRTNEDGTKTLHVDSVSKHMLFKLSVVDTYTKIDVDFNHAVAEYDLLKENYIFDIIEGFIGEVELSELKHVLDMTEKDVISNEYEPHAFISNQVERFGGLLGLSLSPALEKLVSVIENLDTDKIVKAFETVDKVDKHKITKLFK